MTETEWKNSNDPAPMLKFLRGKASDRKLRLFSAACFRRLVPLLPDLRQQQVIETLEQLAEGTVTLAESEGLIREVRRLIPPDDRHPSSWFRGEPSADHLHYIGLMLFREFRSKSIAAHAVEAAKGLADWSAELQEQVQLMKCIVGDPFHTKSIDPRWLTSATLSSAQTIYEERVFDRLPDLANIMEDAGCDDVEILTHCRAQEPHAKGCWVIDLTLGKS